VHALRGEELGQVLVAGLEQDGQVAAVDHARAERAARAHDVAEMGIQLRGAAGQVERGGAARREIAQHLLRGLERHRLRARGPGVHMAVQARLVADITQVHLQGFEAAAGERRKIGTSEER